MGTLEPPIGTYQIVISAEAAIWHSTPSFAHA